MNLYKEILASILSKESIHIVFPNLTLSANELVELKSYNALKEIRSIITDDSLSDAECFMKIEKIVCLFEEIGSSGGNRHDF